MSCGTKNKNCYAKSCVRYYNDATQTFVAETPLTLQIAGARVVDSGISIDAQPSSYTILKRGIYHLSADIDFTADAVGTVVLGAYLDGVLLPCTRIVRSTSANSPITAHYETDLEFDNCCCDITKNITFGITGGAGVGGTITHICTGITKIA